jgi:DNA-binding transcriptional ArsR family regulator
MSEKLEKIELIMHPVRMRILTTLLGEELTTQEISERLPDVPTSSIYRHLRLLLEGELLEIAEARLVNGIQEKVYRVDQPAALGPEDMRDVSAEDHFRYFTTYVLTLLHGFASYLEDAKEHGGVDMVADFAGYREVSFYANPEELRRLAVALGQAMAPLLENGPGEGRRKYKIATVSHPVGPRRADSGEQEQEGTEK